jgi:hypothetical protein
MPLQSMATQVTVVVVPVLNTLPEAGVQTTGRLLPQHGLKANAENVTFVSVHESITMSDGQ